MIGVRRTGKTPVLHPDFTVKKGATLESEYEITLFNNINEAYQQDPDLVVIATPTFNHAESIIQAAENGVNILVEKPGAINTNQARAVMSAVKKNKVGFFLGSSIGNFYNKEERKFLKNAKKTLGKNSFLFVGVDLIKNIKILMKAYDDKENFTAKFNLNLINIINKKVRAKLKVKDFKYIATFNKKKSSMENFIISKKNQIFFINKKKFHLKKNEKIQTEISKKFTISKFSKLAKSSGWHVQKYWKDTKKYYAVFLLQS